MVMFKKMNGVRHFLLTPEEFGAASHRLIRAGVWQLVGPDFVDVFWVEVTNGRRAFVVRKI